MNLSKLVSQSQKGVTLLELLLAMTILSIVLLTFTRFFYQAGTYNLSNQNKTVALNVARNAMMFLEKESFIDMRNKLYEDSTPVQASKNQLSLFLCDEGYRLSDPWKKDPPELPSGCRPVTINNGEYEVTVSAEMSPSEESNTQFYNYYIPVKVKVSWYQNENRKETELEGTIKSEDLR